MSHAIDLNVLRAVLIGTERMAEYYERSEEKGLQNAALVAAGLPPLHSESALKWDVENAAEKRREVECLRAVIAHFEGRSAAGGGVMATTFDSKCWDLACHFLADVANVTDADRAQLARDLQQKCEDAIFDLACCPECGAWPGALGEECDGMCPHAKAVA